MAGEIDTSPISDQVAAELPLFREGVLDNDRGTIDNLGGSAFPASNVGRAIGNFMAERFALLHFEAEQTGIATFTMNQGRSRIATVPVSSLHSADLDFEVQTVTVVEPVGAAEFSSETEELAVEPLPDVVGPEAVVLDVAMSAEGGGQPNGEVDDESFEVGSTGVDEIPAVKVADVVLSEEVEVVEEATAPVVVDEEQNTADEHEESPVGSSFLTACVAGTNLDHPSNFSQMLTAVPFEPVGPFQTGAERAAKNATAEFHPLPAPPDYAGRIPPRSWSAASTIVSRDADESDRDERDRALASWSEWELL